MLKEKFKNLFAKKEGESNKKRLENIVVFIVILVITLIVINVIWNGDDSSNTNDKQTTDANKRLAQTHQEVTKEENNSTSQNDIVSNLEEILSKINGVGKVKVMITYSETSKTVPVYNEESTEENTEETDSEGGTRKVTQTDVKKEVVYEEDDNGKKLITQSIISPSIEGAIVTAEGAGDPTVKTNIIQAVGAVTGLATHKIQVFQMAS